MVALQFQTLKYVHSSAIATPSPVLSDDGFRCGRIGAAISVGSGHTAQIFVNSRGPQTPPAQSHLSYLFVVPILPCPN
jgi:hypothetical protein